MVTIGFPSSFRVYACPFQCLVTLLPSSSPSSSSLTWRLFPSPRVPQLLRRLPAASAARVRVSKVFALFAGVEAAMKTVLEENPHFLPLLQVPSEERSERGSFSFDESLRGFQASPCVSGEFFGDAEEAEHALFLERLYSQKPSLLQWNTFREVAAVKRRLLAPLFSSVERAAVDGCLQRIVEELPASLSSPGSKAADTRERTAARGEMAATEDVEQLHALCELERLLCHVQQQYLCLLPPASLVAPLSSLSLAVLETLLSLACVCEAGDERARAFVAAVVARGEVLLSAFWTDFHKHVRVGSDMLRNVRRLLFADSPFLLHEVLTLLPQQEPWLCSENGTFSSSSSASSSSCLASPASLVTSSLPPLLVAVHLLYRLPAQSHSQQSPAGPPACLRLPGGAPELARRLSAYLRRERREPYGEGEEELETEHEETVQKLRRDLRHVVTLWGKGEESKESTGDGREGEERRERRKARGWMHRDREEEKREDLKLLTQVARLLNAAVNGGREVAEGNAREIVSSAHEAPEKSTPASSFEQTPLSAGNAVPAGKQKKRENKSLTRGPKAVFLGTRRLHPVCKLRDREKREDRKENNKDNKREKSQNNEDNKREKSQNNEDNKREKSENNKDNKREKSQNNKDNKREKSQNNKDNKREKSQNNKDNKREKSQNNKDNKREKLENNKDNKREKSENKRGDMRIAPGALMRAEKDPAKGSRA
ncbi:hypothetical protein TGPRC2_251730B [Toxoplasma gondii TgCatPRC2]|uniref:Uncharacterized protein n=1 Tax=Toxoplasma gondii TgCatPRC2 TaxID=1130821 RepID=A0A151H0T9_TOXGO|nr:hypothetical protein TGPRC2_251730B [Toxoplasma gondii TgCatPRC2]